MKKRIADCYSLAQQQYVEAVDPSQATRAWMQEWIDYKNGQVDALLGYTDSPDQD